MNVFFNLKIYNKVSHLFKNVKNYILSERVVKDISNQDLHFKSLNFEENITLDVGRLVLHNMKEKTKLEDIEFLALLKILNTMEDNKVNLDLARKDNDIPVSVFNNVLYILEKNNIAKKVNKVYILDKEKICSIYFA